jgi:hypothetical protein
MTTQEAQKHTLHAIMLAAYQRPLHFRNMICTTPIFHLSDVVKPGFIDAVLEIHIYDSYDHFKMTRIFDFWWEIDPRTGEGYYAWDEVKE